MKDGNIDHKGYDRIDPNSVDGFNEQHSDYEWDETKEDFVEAETPEKGGFLKRNDYDSRN